MKTEIPVQREIEALSDFFINSRKKDIVSMEAYLIKENYDELEKIFHNIKGISMPYGYPTIGDLAKALEEACVKRDRESLTRNLNKLKDFLSKY
ncbi:MAG: Hpt domain-containing protein [Bdellovibrionaceae bacterium]|nr:Hpt domain-containing protein [Pseudobdellovibrionaceae bacterium]NUM59619.1 Hpt domain-containing protein [Pseudobdellovibrionaceae bacterium]